LTLNGDGPVDVNGLLHVLVNGALDLDVENTILLDRAVNNLFNRDRDGTRNLLDLLNRDGDRALNNLFERNRDRHLDVVRDLDGKIDELLNRDGLVNKSGHVLDDSAAEAAEATEASIRGCNPEATNVAKSIKTCTWQAEGLCSDGKD
jgi:hypothetical protein